MGECNRKESRVNLRIKDEELKNILFVHGSKIMTAKKRVSVSDTMRDLINRGYKDWERENGKLSNV